MLTSDGISASVRAADVDDADLLAGLDVATWATGYGDELPADLIASLPSSPWHNVDFWNGRLADTSRAHWVWIVETSEPVGYVTFGANMEPDWPAYAGEIERLYFLESWRGRGLGSLVWRKAVDRLGQAELLPYLTTVFTFNTGAQRFYERQCGRRVGEQSAFEWHGEPIRDYVYGFECHEHTH